MSPYYPTPKNRIEVCASCLMAKSNPRNLVSPRCCKEPIIYTYQLVDNQPAFVPPPDKPADPKQTHFAFSGKVERCTWCDERHIGGVENCGDDRNSEPPGWSL